MCQSADERDRRWRASLLVEAGGGAVVVDCGPEFRLQMIRADVRRLDALFLTHGHADHLHGIDDVRPFTAAAPLALYAQPFTINEVRERFSYIFNKVSQEGGGRPRITPHETREGDVVECAGLRVEPLPVKHGVLDVLGWKFSEASGQTSVAYITDVSAVPESTLRRVCDCETLIVGSLRETPHATHFSFDEALAFARETGARTVYLTHICHNHRHAEIESYCERWISAHNALGMNAHPAYDGLEVEVY